MMGICGGLVGPKSENVDFILVFVCFFEGSRGARRCQPNEKASEPEWLLVEKVTQKVGKRKKDEPLDMRWQV